MLLIRWKPYRHLSDNALDNTTAQKKGQPMPDAGRHCQTDVGYDALFKY